MKTNSRHSSSMPARGTRVAEQLLHELAQLVRAEVKDPRVGLVTLTGVELTPDYAYATVYFTALPDDEASLARSLEGLRKAAGFLRSQIGRRVRIHTTPELRFKHDQSVARGAEMSVLIDAANARRSADEATETNETQSAVSDSVPATVPESVPDAVPDHIRKK
jgi:ribosome-binding factor A